MDTDETRMEELGVTVFLFIRAYPGTSVAEFPAPPFEHDQASMVAMYLRPESERRHPGFLQHGR